MRHGVPTCSEPSDPNSLYFRLMYHEFFFGPFPDEQSVVAALKTLDAAEEYWDYDGICIHRGDPKATDYVTGLPFVSDEDRKRIETARRS